MGEIECAAPFFGRKQEEEGIKKQKNTVHSGRKNLTDVNR